MSKIVKALGFKEVRWVVGLFLLSTLIMGVRIWFYGFDAGLLQSIFGNLEFNWRWFTMDILAGVTMLGAWLKVVQLKG